MVAFRTALILALASLLPPAAALAQPAQTQTPAVTPLTATTLTAANKQRRIEQVIADAEAAYQNGLANYNAGHLAAAKSNFNYAVDQMLTCGIDIKSTPDLDAEFERIVDAVNTIEMDSLQQGNGLAPPTPVGLANDVTFPVNPAIRAEAEAQVKTTRSDLPLVMNDAVASYINFFTNTRAGHATIVNSLERAGRYKAMIQRVLKKFGLPQDLIYQAVAESGFRPRAINPGSGAGGMWQFMPGDVHAPPHDAWYDDRFDPVASTEAYARYMKYLYSQFDNWYLAMAAYDWGALNVQKAVERTGYADFWQLYKRNNLPQETKNYVPIILAVTIMAKNPKQYGLADLKPDPPLVEDTVQTDYSVSLQLAADIVGSTPEQLAQLNPSLLRGVTPPDETFNLHLPEGTAKLFEQRIAGIPIDKRRYWRYHTLTPSDTLAGVAREYHVSIASLEEVNQIDSPSDLSGMDALIIPEAPRTYWSRRSTRIYRVRRGDTLTAIADRYGVSVEDLRRWNHLRSSELGVGRRLYVAEPAHVYRRVYRHRRYSRRYDPHRRREYSRRRTSKSTGHSRARARRNDTTAHHHKRER